MTIYKITRSLLAIVCVSVLSLNAHSAIMTFTLGNGSTGFADGSVQPFFPNILFAQTGQPAPFDVGHGSELFSDPAAINWLFSYVPITGSIISATLEIGLFDLDTASTGSQLDQFVMDGVDETTNLNTLFEAKNSGDNVYNEFSIALGPSFFALLMDGSFSVSLDVGGSGLQTALVGGGVSQTNANGFHAIYSRLTIETRQSTVPETNSIILLLIALLGICSKRLAKA